MSANTFPSGAGHASPHSEHAPASAFAAGTELLFHKYEGAGNDFVVLDGRQSAEGSAATVWPAWTAAQVSGLCDRHFGIGADGLIVLQKPQEAGCAFHMAYYNADGCLSSFCGNGARCATAFAGRLGLLEQGRARFTAADGLHEAELLEDGRVRLAMADVEGLRRDGEAYVLDTGSPHWVEFLDLSVEALQRMDFHAFAREVRYREAYAQAGINVNLAVADAEGLHMRTYERGVENETLSCGTGVTAAALAYAVQHQGDGVHRIHVQTSGGELDVEFRHTKGNFTDVHLIGPARRVFEGRFTA